MSFRQRLTLWYTVLLFAMLLFFGVGLYFTVRYSYYNETQTLLELRAQAVEDWHQFRATEGAAAINSNDPVRFQPPPYNVDPNVYIELRQTNGILAERSENLNDVELPWDEPVRVTANSGQTTVAETTWADTPVMLRTEPVFLDGRISYVVQVATSMQGVQANLQRLALYIASGIMATLAIAILLGAWIAERALGPVDAVTQAALKITRADDLSRRLPPYQSNDELGRLIDAFNEMLGRLEDVFRDQQRFVADVSHDIRSPLTALQGNIHLLKRGMISDPEEQMETLNTLESEVARLTRLANDLLLLARADGGEKMMFRPLELDTLLLEVFRQARSSLATTNSPIKLRLGAEDQATIMGDPDRLRRLFTNLVDNAIRYTNEGEVTISLYKDEANHEVRVAVQDTGIGIPADALPNLFKRFFRTDKARSRALGGTGLGLAIVQWIAEGHHAQVDVQSEEGVGTTFTIIFPLPSQTEISAAKSNTGAHRAIPVPAGR